MPRIMCHRHPINDSDREFMTTKVNRLKKFYERIHEVSIILDAEKHIRQVEILLWGPHLNLRVKGEAEDLRTAFESALNKAERWLRKTKERMWGDRMHRRHNVTIRRFHPIEVLTNENREHTEQAGARPLLPVERLEPQYMNLDEARREMEERDGLLVFVNPETHEINILHRNKDKQVELVELGEVIPHGESRNASDMALG